jgi:hypothetical protein
MQKRIRNFNRQIEVIQLYMITFMQAFCVARHTTLCTTSSRRLNTSALHYTLSNGRVTIPKCIGKHLEGNGCVLFKALSRNMPLRAEERPRRTAVRLANVSADIRTESLPNADLGRYRYTILLNKFRRNLLTPSSGYTRTDYFQV